MSARLVATIVSGAVVEFIAKYGVEPNTVLICDEDFASLEGTSYEKDFYGLVVISADVKIPRVALCKL